VTAAWILDSDEFTAMGRLSLEIFCSRPRNVFATFALIAVLKITLVAIYGPISVPDTSGYVTFARAILQSDTWLHDAQLSSGAVPLFAVRMIGYPAILATAMEIGGTNWPYLVVALQFMVTIAALWAIYAFALELGLSWQLAVFAVVAFATSEQLVTDQCLLTDSLNADFIIIALFILARGIRSGRPLSVWGAAAGGALLALAFLLREAMPLLATMMLPLLIVRCFRGWSGALVLRSVLMGTLVLVPLMTTVEIYKAWNSHRTGERFVTTSAQVTLMYALINAAKHDHTVFDGDAPLDQAARRAVHNYVFDEVAPINSDLVEQGYRPTDVARMSQAHYFATWRSRPVAMLHLLRDHISEEVAKLAFRPLSASCDLIEWATTVRQCPDYRDLMRAVRSSFVHEPHGSLTFFLFQTCELTVSIGLFSAFVVGVPVLWVRSWRRSGWRVTGPEWLVFTFWAMYVGWFLLYAAVNMERRYMNPVVPLSILGGLVIWQEMVRSARVPRAWHRNAADPRTAQT
jgi:hypothetical protein